MPAYGVVRIWIDCDTSFLYAASRNDFLDRCYFYRGLRSYESETFRTFAFLAGKARRVLDVGAHSGIYTLIACAVNPESEVVAFEPIPYIWDNLVENIRLNGWEDRCTAYCAAASERSGTGVLAISQGREYFSTLERSKELDFETEKMQVPVVAIDEAIGADAVVDLMKIDVEGHEEKVLLGARRLLSRCLPDIIVECTDGEVCGRIQDILDPLGYDYFHLTECGLKRMEAIVPDDPSRFRNYLCTVRK